MHAVAERYSGHYRPTGASSALPAVHFWSFWNEPNFGTALRPETTNGSTVPTAAAMYRALINNAWKAMHQTGHRHDTLLIGELDPLGNALAKPGRHSKYPGTQRVLAPLSFVRSLYCVDDDYQRVTGSTARSWRCPTTTAAARKFRSANPALFSSTGFAIHPYPFKEAPNANPSKINNNYATFPVLSRLTSTLDRSLRARGSHRRMPLYNTEFGYITHPPNGKGYPSPTTAAAWLNQTEYLSYKNRRLNSYDQYLLRDPASTPQNPHPGFNTGLYTSNGRPKVTAAAFRLPLWLPRTRVKAGAKTEIWGGARPATVAPPSGLSAQIQMQKGGRGTWTTILTVRVKKKTGYFDIHSKLPYSGKLRLAYRYSHSEPLLPTGVAGSTVYSRTVTVKVSG